MLDEDQNLSHVAPSQPSSDELLRGQELGHLAPPSPSSFTIMPACRGGRVAKLDHLGGRAGQPDRGGVEPRSASDSVCTGFFFAAMIPLNDGYRGSLIFSTTLTTAGSVASTAS